MKLMSSSIGRKVLMALSGLFLVVFLTQHFFINITSVFSESLFNTLSHFMGSNPIVQFLLQPILILNASWISRNMIFSGGVILLFLVLHFIDFWIPEMNYKYVEVLPQDPNRYFEELVHKFESPLRTVIYSISFIFLALHLLHGFSSSFKTVGVNSKYYNLIQKFTFLFSLLIPIGFIFIAIFHNLTS